MTTSSPSTQNILVCVFSFFHESWLFHNCLQTAIILSKHVYQNQRLSMLHLSLELEENAVVLLHNLCENLYS